MRFYKICNWRDSWGVGGQGEGAGAWGRGPSIRLSQRGIDRRARRLRARRRAPALDQYNPFLVAPKQPRAPDRRPKAWPLLHALAKLSIGGIPLHLPIHDAPRAPAAAPGRVVIIRIRLLNYANAPYPWHASLLRRR